RILAQNLKDPEGAIRLQAAQALVRVGPKGKEAVPGLSTVLRDTDPRIREAAASALAGIGPDARAAFPALVVASQDTNAQVRSVSKRALARLASSGRWTRADLPIVLDALNDKEAEIHGHAIEILRGMGPDGLTPFTEKLKDKNAEVRLEAIK